MMKAETISESKCGSKKQVVLHGKDGGKKVSRTMHLVRAGVQWKGLKSPYDWAMTNYGEPVDMSYAVTVIK